MSYRIGAYALPAGALPAPMAGKHIGWYLAHWLDADRAKRCLVTLDGAAQLA